MINGNVYEGGFDKGLRYGKGTLITKSGEILKGNFKDG